MTRSMFIAPLGAAPGAVRRGGGYMAGGVYRPGSDRRACYVLVPLADLFNHANAPCDAVFDPQVTLIFRSVSEMVEHDAHPRAAA
jgi:hypothetical protein